MRSNETRPHPTTEAAKGQAGLITQAEAHELLDYDPDTGVFKWRVNVNSRVHAGDVAGSIDAKGYRTIKARGKPYRAHRLAHLIMTGSWPTGDIDHSNHVKLDNRWSNLRDVLCRDNQKNRGRWKSNKSGVTGVCRHERFGKWQAQIGLNNKNIYLGRYEDFFDAVCARKSAELRYGFHENHGRVAA